jgi:hypothetical protein
MRILENKYVTLHISLPVPSIIKQNKIVALFLAIVGFGVVGGCVAKIIKNRIRDKEIAKLEATLNVLKNRGH